MKKLLLLVITIVFMMIPFNVYANTESTISVGETKKITDDLTFLYFTAPESAEYTFSSKGITTYTSEFSFGASKWVEYSEEDKALWRKDGDYEYIDGDGCYGNMCICGRRSPGNR